MVSSSDLTPLCFILAPSYHGANALSAHLNGHPDIFSLGAGNPVPSEDPICSCGEPISSCPFWKVIDLKMEKAEDDPFDTMLPQSPFLASNNSLNNWINGGLSLIANEVGPKSWSMVYEQAERFEKMQNLFLVSAKEWVEHKVFVDAERSNLKFMVITSMGFPVKGAIHLVRDPRGYVAAWKKYYPESTAEKLTLEWVAAHTRIKRLRQFFTKVPFLTVLYEDFIGNRDETTRKMAEFMRVDQWADSSAGTADSRKNHLIGLGPQDHVMDPALTSENWRESLSLEDQERVIRAAGPLFSEFGYKA